MTENKAFAAGCSRLIPNAQVEPEFTRKQEGLAFRHFQKALRVLLGSA